MVSVFAFCSDDPSSNPAEVSLQFSVKVVFLNCAISGLYIFNSPTVNSKMFLIKIVDGYIRAQVL